MALIAARASGPSELRPLASTRILRHHYVCLERAPFAVWSRELGVGLHEDQVCVNVRVCVCSRRSG